MCIYVTEKCPGREPRTCCVVRDLALFFLYLFNVFSFLYFYYFYTFFSFIFFFFCYFYTFSHLFSYFFLYKRKRGDMWKKIYYVKVWLSHVSKTRKEKKKNYNNNHRNKNINLDEMTIIVVILEWITSRFQFPFQTEMELSSWRHSIQQKMSSRDWFFLYIYETQDITKSPRHIIRRDPVATRTPNAKWYNRHHYLYDYW